jgi:hypothetical protein
MRRIRATHKLLVLAQASKRDPISPTTYNILRQDVRGILETSWSILGVIFRTWSRTPLIARQSSPQVI